MIANNNIRNRVLYQALFFIVVGLLVQCDSCKVGPNSQKNPTKPNPQKSTQLTPITEEMIRLASVPSTYDSKGFLAGVLRSLKDQPDTTDINARNPHIGERLTALHHAAILGNEKIFQALLDRGAKVDILDNDKALPLHYAAKRPGNSKILTLLLDKGRPDYLKMKYISRTPLELATEFAKDPYMIKLLQERGATK